MNDISLPKLSVLDSEMAYREAGSRDAPVALFLHGNPTSSFIWRKIIPARRAGRALHRAGPYRLRPIGQAGHRLSHRGSCALPRRVHRRGGDKLCVPGRSGLGNGARLSPSRASPGFRARPCVHGVHPAVSDLGGVCKGLARARDLPQVSNARRRGETDFGRQCLRRAGAAGRDAAQADGRRDGGLSRAVSDARSRRPTWRFPERDPDRRRAFGCLSR